MDINATKMFRIIAILALLAGVVFIIMGLVRGVPFLELFTENWGMWIGLLLPSFVAFVLYDKDGKNRELEQEGTSEKQIVITGKMMVRGICILTIAVVIISTIVMLVRGIPVRELFVDNWWIWPGLIVATSGALFPEGKKK